MFSSRVCGESGLIRANNQHVSSVEPEDDNHDLPDRERGLSGAGDRHGDPRLARDAAAALRAQRHGALPGAGAAGHATAVLRPDAAAHGAAHGAAYGAAHGATGDVPDVPAELRSPERQQQPGFRSAVPASDHAGGELISFFC